MVKIRRGFVSNSSSSSFIIVGTKLGSLNNLEKQQLMDGFGVNYSDYNHIDDAFTDKLCYGNHPDIDILPGDDGYYFIGKILAQFDGDYMEDGSLDIEKIITVGDKLKEKGIDGEVKVYYGTR